ncbi:hypothetical protein [Faecalitalea cylindroides]|uniref:hypothetical protein n=1 Tax=Faecalitalea cylindroides TaxID=39483 RepID=UPI00242E627B|nr:hypothetical protein [Faecalitalea cylindroides]
MSKDNPQSQDFRISQNLIHVIDITSIISFVLASIQSYTSIVPHKLFLFIAAFLFIAEKVISYYQVKFFEEAHKIRQTVLLDNSFGEKRIPNYDSSKYFDNESIQSGEIKLLANIHENTLYTVKIIEKMLPKYYVISTTLFVLLILQVCYSGINDFSSSLLNFVISSDFVIRTIKLRNLRKAASSVFEKANSICSDFEKNMNTVLITRKIINIFVEYEEAVFESKIVLNEKVHRKQNSLLLREWEGIKKTYKIYSF